MSKALYRKYRSKRLDEIVGQKHVTDILSRSLKADRIAHAYLLTGPRGVGKTSIARILAHEINNLPYTDEDSHLDIIEIDAASNNGVEDIRMLREKVQIAPVSARKKIYIIDEVHMLSKAAFNALLKTLEEPPEHVVFILATTDYDKLPATIISRTQRFCFRPISRNDAIEHLGSIASQENIAVSPEALTLIAEHGEGSFRDSISLLDQLQSIADPQTGITPALIEEVLGQAPAEIVDTLIASYISKDTASIISLLDECELRGISAGVLAKQLMRRIREQIATSPQLIRLLDELLQVSRSSNESIKLLVALINRQTPKPKSAALVSSAPTISAPVSSLLRPVAASTQHSTTTTDTPNTTPSTSSSATSPTPKSQSRASESTLDWNTLIDYAKNHFVAVYSVLSKCDHEATESDLTLYTGNAFYKKKLDDPKHRTNLMIALQAVTGGDWNIHTVGTALPPRDSKLAAVAAIMGGGKEVAVEDD